LTGLLADKKTDTFNLRGVKTTAAEMAALLKTRETNAEAVAATAEAYHAAVQKHRTHVAATEEQVTLLVDCLIATRSEEELGKYGLAPPKKRPRTPEAQLVSKVKRLATRVAAGPTARQRKLADTKKELAQIVGNDDGASAPPSPPPDPAKPNAA
jgi:hypothetical protein